MGIDSVCCCVKGCGRSQNLDGQKHKYLRFIFFAVLSGCFKTAVIIMQQERIVYADLMRILATFAVIMLHTAASLFQEPVDGLDWAACNVYDSLVRWSVPVFVMLSGMFFLNPEREIPMQKLYKKNILRLIIALVVWGLFYQLTGDHNLEKANSSFLNNLPTWEQTVVIAFARLPFGPAWYHLWFLYMLIGLYILTPLYRIFVKNAEKKDFVYLLILFAVFGIIVPQISKVTEHINPVLKINFRMSELINYSGYFFAGYFFSKYEISKKITKLIYIGGFLSYIFTIVGTHFLSAKVGHGTEFLYSNLMPTTMLEAFAIFLALKSLKTKEFSDRQYKVISQLSASTFGIYLIHAFLLKLFSDWGFTSNFINPIIAIPIKAISVFVVSFVIIFLLRKIPGSKYIM